MGVKPGIAICLAVGLLASSDKKKSTPRGAYGLGQKPPSSSGSDRVKVRSGI